DLWLKLGKLGGLANISDYTVAYRIHDGNISRKKKKIMAIITDKLIEKYKNDYPNYFFAKIKSWLRIIKSSI
ncbi:MAG: hypothetical protein WCO30_02335, partial [bacterium]